VSRYQFQESDIYLPGTDIPKNRLGITEADLLHEIEAALLQQAYQIFIAELQPATRFDEAYFKSLHQRTWASLYDWAGEYRSVDMSKGGSLFCRAEFLEKESQRLFRQLEQEDYLKQTADWPKGKFAERMAHYQCELIALHPFYELNGRITRLFFDLIAIYNGYGPIDYSQTLGEAVDETNAYIHASIACVRAADNSMLRQIILDGLNKAEAP
jgi:cell filamentation protein